MSGTFGRTKNRVSAHQSSMKIALSEDAVTARKSRNSVRSSTEMIAEAVSRKGDPDEVVEAIANPHEDAGLQSFLPPSLQCLDKFLPSAMLRHPPDQATLLGVAGAAPTVAQNVIGELSRMQAEAPTGLHTLAFLGGLLLLISSLLNIVYNVMKLGPLHTFFAVMMFIFSVLILTLEQQRTVFPSWFRANLERYFLFMTLIAGRGGFYIYIGMTQAAVNWKSSSFSLLVGLFIIFVGGLYIHTGISVGTKLHQLRESLQSPEAIKHAFMTADVNGDGELDKGELMKLMAVLGTSMTEKEADTCLELMDKPDEDGIKNGKISLLEFMTFMERSDSSVLF